RLTFPILEPCLRELLRMHPEGLDLLVLFGTDQREGSHRDTDTLYFAQILERLLPQRLGPQLRGVRVHLLQGINPALYDEAFDAMEDALRQMPREVDVCYAILAGGTPACNAALLLQGVRHYGDRLQAVYLPIAEVPRTLRIGRQVMDAFREEVALERLRAHDFASAQRHLETLRAPSGVIALVEHAARRLDFDFLAARRALERAFQEGGPDLRAFLRAHRLREDLNELLEPGDSLRRLPALLRELFWNARATYRHHRYADFLGRVYRMQEAILRLLVERIFGLPTDLSPAVREETQRRWVEGIESHPALREYLERQTVDGRPLDWRNIARPTYKALLAYAVDPDLGKDRHGNPMLSEEQRKRYRALLQRVNALDPLVELRHRTIIGHDFQGVSREILQAHYAPRRSDGRVMDPVEGLAEILRMLDIEIRDDPYEA
ncbi:MAG: hypothetical protein ACK4OK_09130, partial [Thermoflexus sp.]